MKKRVSDIIKYTLAAAVAGVLLYFVLRNINWSLVAEGLAHCKWGFILLMVLANIISVVFRAVRWRLLTNPVAPGERRMTVINAYFIGNMFNSLLPGSGEFIRCGFIRTSEASYQKVLGTVLTERIWDAISLIILTIIALSAGSEAFATFCRENVWEPMRASLMAKWWIVPAVAGGVILLVALYRILKKRIPSLQKVGSFFKGLLEGLLSFRNMKNKGTFLLLTVGIWVMYWIGMHCVLLAMPELCHLHPADSLMLTVTGNLASVIPAPGSIGAYHYLITEAVANIYSATKETGLLYAVLNHEPVLLTHLTFGFICYLAQRAYIRKKRP
ncbi:MAG: flippase-like domain-containing protein [Bacteroidales bacterium]|nr:flippase-like domain-containing protein [Bacteroidales bacterium]